MQYTLTAASIAALAVTVAAQSTTTEPYPAGSTLPNGGYICNPAHAYPAGQSCDGSNGTPTLVMVPTSTPYSYPAGSTLPNGGYICNPAHAYPAGQSCDGSNGTPTLVMVPTSTPSSYPAGSTLPNGGYICNPAHAYPAGQSCDGSNGTPTLVMVSAQNTAATTTAVASWGPAGTTTNLVSTYTGAAATRAPVVGAVALGIMALFA